MAQPLVLSGSSLNTFLRCAHQWELAYVRRVRQPPSLKQALGIAGHAAAELDLAQKIESHADLPLDVVLDAFSDSWKKESYGAEGRRDETNANMKDSGIAVVKLWRLEVAPTYQPALVEKHIQFKLNGIVIDGTIDEVDVDGTIRDHKFVSRTPSSGEAYVLNMTGYGIGYRVLTGQLESRIVLDHMVRTKEPKHVAIVSDGPIPDESITAYADIVETVSRSIEAGIFPPTGLKSNACSWCGYATRDGKRGACRYYRP